MNSITLNTKHYPVMCDFLTKVLEWELKLGEKKSECLLENLKLILNKSVESHEAGSIEFDLDIDELKDLKNRFEFFLYSNPSYKDLFEQEFLKIDLKKESQYEIQDPDKRCWKFKGKH